MPRPKKSPDYFVKFIDTLADAVAERLGSRRGAAAPARKRTFSKAGLERIRAAQKKRWAKFRKSK